MEGLDKFREAFESYSDNYVIIGGTASEITLREGDFRPRPTHDIDMIVIVETMTPEFANRFWQFIREAGYRPEKRKLPEDQPVKYELYRFVDGKLGYPQMIELLSRHADALGEPQGLVIEPLLTSDDTSSLSAIIMDDDYYFFTIRHSQLTDGIRHADPAALVALKMRAYLNLLADKNEGKHVNSKDIKKHRSDVLKNIVVTGDEPIEAPAAIVNCANDFVLSLRSNWNELSDSLAKSLGQSPDFIEALLERLETLFFSAEP